MEGKNCTARAPREGECCPDVYDCEVKAEEPQLIADNLPKVDEATTDASTIADAENVAEDAVAVTTFAPQSDDISESAATTTSVDDSENEIHDKDDSTEKPIIRVEEVTTVLNDEEQFTNAPVDDESAGSRLSEGQTEAPLSPEEDVGPVTTVAPERAEEDLAGAPIEPQAPQESEQPIEAITFAAQSDEELTTQAPSAVESVEPIQSAAGEDNNVLLANSIPGEGDCLLDGVSYANSSNVASRNHCELSCQCLNSIVQCENVRCAPPPENAWKCKVSRSEEECCLRYECEEAPTTEGQREVITAEPIITSRPEEVGDEEGSGEYTTKAPVQSQEDEQITTQAAAVASIEEASSTQEPERLPISSTETQSNLLPLDEVYTAGPIESDSHRTEQPASITTEAVEISAAAFTEPAAAPEQQATEVPIFAATSTPQQAAQPAITADEPVEREQTSTEESASEVSTSAPAAQAADAVEPETIHGQQEADVEPQQAPEIVTESDEAAGTTYAPVSIDHTNIQTSIQEIIQQTVEDILQEFAQPDATTIAPVSMDEISPALTADQTDLDNRIDESIAGQTEQAPIQHVEPIAAVTEAEGDITTQRVQEHTIIEAASVTQQQQTSESNY